MLHARELVSGDLAPYMAPHEVYYSRKEVWMGTAWRHTWYTIRAETFKEVEHTPSIDCGLLSRLDHRSGVNYTGLIYTVYLGENSIAL